MIIENQALGGLLLASAIEPNLKAPNEPMVIRIEINFFDSKIVIGQQTGKILHGIIEYMDGNSQIPPVFREQNCADALRVWHANQQLPMRFQNSVNLV